MKFKKLMEKRATLQEEMEMLIKTAETEERAMSQDEMKSFDEKEKEIKDIDETLSREERARLAEKAKTDKESKEVEDRAVEEERAFTEYILSAVENRSAIQLTQGNNGAIVPTTISNKIITAIKEQVPFLKCAQVLSTSGKLSVPVYNEDETNFIKADYVDEGAALTDNVGKFTTIDLNGYVVGALSLISNKLKNNTEINVTDFIVQQVAKAISAKLMTEFTVGSTKIKGVCEAKATVTAASATAITYEELLKLKRSINQIYRANGVWIMHPETYTVVLSLKDANGRPYFEEGKGLFGRPVIESEDMAKIGSSAKVIVFGDLGSGYTIKGTTAVEVQVLREKYIDRNMIGVIGFAEYDASITDTKAIGLLAMGA